MERGLGLGSYDEPTCFALCCVDWASALSTMTLAHDLAAATVSATSVGASESGDLTIHCPNDSKSHVALSTVADAKAALDGLIAYYYAVALQRRRRPKGHEQPDDALAPRRRRHPALRAR